eukprot:14719575-Alexandrium_andersonii.AAC.1
MRCSHMRHLHSQPCCAPADVRGQARVSGKSACVVRCLLCIVCCALCVVRCALCAACCVLRDACCVFRVVQCVLRVACRAVAGCVLRD